MTKKSNKEEPTWVEVTPETVTSPTDLLRVANHVFDELRRDMPIVKYPELKAIKDTLDTLGEALSWESLRPEQEGVLYQRLEPLEGLPSREIIDARINYYMQEWRARHVDHLSGIPTFLSGSLLTADEVSRNTGIPKDELLSEVGSRESRFIADSEYAYNGGGESPRFYSEQFNPDGTLNERRANYISWVEGYYYEAEEIISDAFMPQVILGFVSPVAYVALSDEHLEACKKARMAYASWYASRWDDAPFDVWF